MTEFTWQAALRVASQSHGGRSNQITAEHLHETEDELKSLQIMTQRMILTQEEMVCVLSLASTYSFIFILLYVLREFQCSS